MSMQEMLSIITSQCMDTLAMKDDITKVQTDIQALGRTVLEKIKTLEGIVFEVVSKNDQLQKEVSVLTKENQAVQDTVKLHERKLKRTEKEQNSPQQHSGCWNLRVYKVPE